MTRLALGTAQFGMDYGITNTGGKVTDGQVRSILELAALSGIDTIDTARLYGDSEAAIGRNMPTEADFRIVTKTGKLGGIDARDAVRALRSDFLASHKALGCPTIYGLLVHNASDLLGPSGPDLWRAMQMLKSEGLVDKIGVSVYEPGDIDRVLDLYDPDIVQLPFNALDRRLVEGGQLSRLTSADVEIHARSLFLQGLLLAPVSRIPAMFEPVRAAIERLDIFLAAHGLGRLEGLLALAFADPTIDRFIVGVTSAEELDAIVQASRNAAKFALTDMPELPAIDPRYLNPSRWPGRAQ